MAASGQKQCCPQRKLRKTVWIFWEREELQEICFKSILINHQGRIKEGGNGGSPRDEMYLFQVKYSFEKVRNSEAIQEYNSILYSYMLR